MIPSTNFRPLIPHANNLDIKRNEGYNQLPSATIKTLKECVEIIFELLYPVSANVENTAAVLGKKQTAVELLAGITKIETYSTGKIIIDIHFVNLSRYKNQGQNSYPDFPFKFILETEKNNTGKIHLYDYNDTPLGVNFSFNTNTNNVCQEFTEHIKGLNTLCKSILLEENLPLINHKNSLDSVSRFKRWFNVFKSIADIDERNKKDILDSLLNHLNNKYDYPDGDEKTMCLLNNILKDNMEVQSSKHIATENDKQFNITENSPITRTNKKIILCP